MTLFIRIINSPPQIMGGRQSNPRDRPQGLLYSTAEGQVSGVTVQQSNPRDRPPGGNVQQNNPRDQYHGFHNKRAIQQTDLIVTVPQKKSNRQASGVDANNLKITRLNRHILKSHIACYVDGPPPPPPQCHNVLFCSAYGDSLQQHTV